MTSSTGTEQHPEVEEISALIEGLLLPERSADVRAHLMACDLCADVHTSLDDIRNLLGTLPGPARMPDDVARRIDAALAAEALLASTDGADVSRETEQQSTAVSRETSRRRRLRMDRPGRKSRTSSRPGKGTRHRRWRVSLLAAAGVSAALGLGTAITQPWNHDAGDGTTARSSTDSTVTVAAIEKRVHVLLSRAEEAPAAESFSTAEEPGSSPSLPACVAAGIDRPERPIAVQRDSFKGTDAFLVVLPNQTDTSRVDAYLVKASCVHTSPDRPGVVLLDHTYARR